MERQDTPLCIRSNASPTLPSILLRNLEALIPIQACKTEITRSWDTYTHCRLKSRETLRMDLPVRTRILASSLRHSIHTHNQQQLRFHRHIFMLLAMAHSMQETIALQC
eukprot:1156199-Pelagomonas_calceolata.AAC.2